MNYFSKKNSNVVVHTTRDMSSVATELPRQAAIMAKPERIIHELPSGGLIIWFYDEPNDQYVNQRTGRVASRHELAWDSFQAADDYSSRA